MKLTKILPIALIGCAGLAQAAFNPVDLTPSSYTYDIVVEASAPQALPYCINVTTGNGTQLGDSTFFEQGFYNRPGLPGANCGIPPQNTVFTSINNTNMQFLMPPDYTANNELMIDSQITSGLITFSSPTTATNLALLSTGGGGSVVVNYTATHADSSTETGTINLLDWYTGGATVAWGANGRVNSGGGYSSINTSTTNNTPPYLYANTITVSGASPVVSIQLDYVSGQHANFYAVSGNSAGTWTPIALDPSSFIVKGIVPATFPLTATMDQGTNTAINGNLATWFENGFVRNVNAGLPVSGSTFASLSQPTHVYKFADYTGNNAILIDTNHQTANVTLANPQSYQALALLTAGGNVGGTPMTNICVLQHADGVNETNLLIGYDWFDNNHPGAIALQGNGRVNMYSRTVNNVGNNYPYLFESYFLLDDTTSPVTNIFVKYKSAGNTSATTYIMAVSATTEGVPPIVNVGPVPTSQTLLPSQTATFTVDTFGTPTITGYWQVENNGTYYPLSDGIDANGSTISGSHTYTLTISNLFLLDGTNYQFVASNAYGTNTSPVGQVIVTPQTISIAPSNPVFYTGNSFPLTVDLSKGPGVGLQWFYVDSSNMTNFIADATNTTYVVSDVTTAMNGYIYGVIATNIYGTNMATVVLNISDSAAFLGSDFTPINAQAYAGAPVTYAVDARGNSPITYQWMINGTPVTGVNSNSYTFAAPCGTTTIQVAFSNSLSGGTWVSTPVVTLQGDPNPYNLTFNSDGTGWQTNGLGGAVPTIANNVLTLTDGNGNEASSMFYTNAMFVGGTWTASFTYNSHGGGADGTAFVIQNITNALALGDGGGSLGYGGTITNNIGKSLAFEINLYSGNNQTIGIAQAVNGETGKYFATDPVDVSGTNDIFVQLNWANGVLSATLTDSKTGDMYTTNYLVGSLVQILDGNLAYIGFCGGDGGVASVQTVSNFQFHSVLPAVSLSAAPPTLNGDIDLSWPNIDPNYQLQMSSSLSSPSWVFGPTPTTTSGTNHVTISTTGDGQQFFRLLRVTCP